MCGGTERKTMPADALPSSINGPILLMAFAAVAFAAFFAVALVLVARNKRRK